MTDRARAMSACGTRSRCASSSASFSAGMSDFAAASSILRTTASSSARLRYSRNSCSWMDASSARWSAASTRRAELAEGPALATSSAVTSSVIAAFFLSAWARAGSSTAPSPHSR
eukprot:CAMPEP_0198588484 /NCGR_PEP_ID=MMETSP1462-20131121/133196_1 /TAXON_ID=1333877 /ORGANISM="Brandtodinium nutriculum, Strain RCC3387" /LENGTH=114 /DNA_ID=CAMNT_0044319989 /DNA_START=76 /DNA_END=416 /DNA_ORIENTATION=-